jgi:integration host factor subunit beta
LTTFPKAEVETVVDSVLGTIAEKLQGNERVDLRGFGGFRCEGQERPTGRNPRTGETIEIAAKRDAGFKPGKDLTEKIGQVGAIAEPA